MLWHIRKAVGCTPIGALVEAPANTFDCGGCGMLNVDRASCEACGTSSPTRHRRRSRGTAMHDAATARAAQVEEAARGNHQLADYLGHVTDAHLDDALALHRLEAI